MLISPFSSCHVDENVHEKEKGDISFDDNDGRRNRSRYDGDLRGILELMVAYMDLCLKRPSTSPLKIGEKLMVVTREMDIGLISATLPPITQLTMVYC